MRLFLLSGQFVLDDISSDHHVNLGQLPVCFIKLLGQIIRISVKDPGFIFGAMNPAPSFQGNSC